MIRNHAVRFAVLLLLGSGAAFAQTEDAPFAPDRADEKAPLRVTSDRMKSDKKRGVVTFTGSVVAVKGSLTVVGDEMVVHTDATGGDFSEIRATGAVRITRLGKVATGDVAHYFRERQTIVLTGNPTLDDGQTSAKGDRVVYNFATEEMTLEGGSAEGNGNGGRATVTLYGDGSPENEETPSRTAPPTEPTTTARSAPPLSSGDYAVQLGAFSDKPAAVALATEMKRKGYNPYLVTGEAGGKRVYRVRIGRFGSLDEAKRMATTLKKQDKREALPVSYENPDD
jgi:lipopolysaccharide export system protein LptA